MRRIPIVTAVLLLLPLPPAAQDRAAPVDARFALPRGAIVELRFAEPRLLPLVDARGRPARRSDLRGDMAPLRATRALGRMREVRGDTVIVELVRVDTTGGGRATYPRRGVRTHVVADSLVVLQPHGDGGARPFVLGVLLGAVVMFGVVLASLGLESN